MVTRRLLFVRLCLQLLAIRGSPFLFCCALFHWIVDAAPSLLGRLAQSPGSDVEEADHRADPDTGLGEAVPARNAVVSQRLTIRSNSDWVISSCSSACQELLLQALSREVDIFHNGRSMEQDFLGQERIGEYKARIKRVARLMDDEDDCASLTMGDRKRARPFYLREDD